MENIKTTAQQIHITQKTSKTPDESMIFATKHQPQHPHMGIGISFTRQQRAALQRNRLHQGFGNSPRVASCKVELISNLLKLGPNVAGR